MLKLICNCVSRKSFFAHSNAPVLPHLLMRSYICKWEALEALHNIFKQMTISLWSTQIVLLLFLSTAFRMCTLSRFPNGLLTLKVLLLLPLERKHSMCYKLFQDNSIFHKLSRSTNAEKPYMQTLSGSQKIPKIRTQPTFIWEVFVLYLHFFSGLSRDINRHPLLPLFFFFFLHEN